MALAALLVFVLASAWHMPAARPSRSAAVAGSGARIAAASIPPLRRREPPPARPQGPRPPRGRWLALFYGGNGQGEIEPCG